MLNKFKTWAAGLDSTTWLAIGIYAIVVLAAIFLGIRKVILQ